MRGGSAVVGRRDAVSGADSAVRARHRGDQPSGAVTRMSGALGEISPSATTSTEANLSVLVMSTEQISFSKNGQGSKGDGKSVYRGDARLCAR